MPASKKKTTARPVPLSEATNGLAGEVLTLPEAAAYLRIGEADLLDLVRSQELPGRSIAGEWRFLKAAIQQWLSAAAPAPEARKAAQLALAGKYREDPDLMRICEEAYRHRREACGE